MLTDPEMIRLFEEKHGDGSYVRFIRNIIIFTAMGVGIAIFLGTHGYI